MRRIKKRSIQYCLAFVLISFSSAGQTSSRAADPPPNNGTMPPATQMEAFKPSAGSVVTMGYDDLGRVAGISIDVREFRSDKGARVRGLVVEIAEGQYRTERSFVDADELPELLKAIDALLEIKANPTNFKNFEVRYATRGDLQLTAFNSVRGAIVYSVRVGRIASARSTGLDSGDMRLFRGLVESAAKKLTSLSLQ